MNILGIIPARMNSSRFPGKPLAKIKGTPMIGQVYKRTATADVLDNLYVATCDEVIRDYILGIGGNVVMTKNTHERCTDRTAEAVSEIERKTGVKADIVVMVQGDEPMVTAKMINDAVTALEMDRNIQVVNVMSPLKSNARFNDPNEVKVVVDINGFALYFSRSPVPYPKRSASKAVPMYKQVCIIPFRREFLTLFNELPQTPLEKAESIDMLRVLEHGYRVKMAQTEDIIYSVDTPEDLRLVERTMSG